MQMHPQMTDIQTPRPGADRPRSASHGHSCRAKAPFARLGIGPGTYEVAEMAGDSALLAFRVEGQQEWTALDRPISDGWVEIAADIMLLDPDVLFEFLQTHALRVTTETEPPYEMEFDTLGVRWSARLLENRDGEVRFGDEAWQHARLGLQAPRDGRARAIMILLATTRDARARFEPHISNWARRISQGVSVQPIL
ncbi:MAG: hypothetical protein RID11_14570 [Roseovarius sp.]|jgi:hypothetical protein|uniref:hypothetical protein n=1 Tax=Roseovarius sp. TaxID=1486281 RepID=UPI0032EE4497